MWVTFGEDEGYPDGMTTDADGHVWVAHWGGSRVSQRDADGRVIRTIAIPAAHVTNVAFGGKDLSDLYITSARDRVSVKALSATPQSGGLFRLKGAARGLLPGVFAG